MNAYVRLGLLICLALSASPGNAGTLNYVIGKFGVVHIPKASDGVSSAIGVLAGYRLDQRYAFELDGTYGLQGNSGLVPSVWTFGGYMAYRELYGRSWFWKVRGGAALSRYNAAGSGDGESVGSISAGAGTGLVLRLSPKTAVVTEAEVTWLGGERTMTSVGVSWPF